MPEQTRQHRRRNPIALAEILQKGGVHENSRKSKRQKQKRELHKTVSRAMATYRGHSFVWISILTNHARIIYVLNKQYC